jgi:hypothetical protein
VSAKLARLKGFAYSNKLWLRIFWVKKAHFGSPFHSLNVTNSNKKQPFYRKRQWTIAKLSNQLQIHADLFPLPLSLS